MHKQIHEKPIRKVRRVEVDKSNDASEKRMVFGDIDDFIFGDERSVPSNR